MSRGRKHSQAALEIVARLSISSKLPSPGGGYLHRLATEENAVVQTETQVEDTRASVHTAAVALTFAMGVASSPPNSPENT
jgi:hypothetical protein